MRLPYDLQSESTVFVNIFFIFISLSVPLSLSLTVLFTFFVAISFCVRTIRNSNKQTNEREIIFFAAEWVKGKKHLLRESRLTWNNSSRNIWIEICVNGCECECDVLNRRKLQLVRITLKTYGSYVLCCSCPQLFTLHRHSASSLPTRVLLPSSPLLS